MTISFTEALGGPVPGTEIEINLQGLGGLPSGDQIRNILVLSERVAAGTSTGNAVTSTPFGSADDASTWFGAGSPGAHQCAYIFDYRNSESGKPKCAVYGAAVAVAGGTAAIQTLTLAVNATASGVWEFMIGGFPVSIAVSTGDTPIVQATALVAAWNALAEKDSVPLTAANGAGANPAVTFTANTAGAHYNNIGLETITDPGIGTTDAWSGTTMGAVGGTPGVGLAPVLTTVIANLASFQGAGQIVIPWGEDGTAAAKSFEVAAVEGLIDHINTQGNATNMEPTSLVVAWKNTAALLAAAKGVAPFASDDDQRVHFVAHPYSAVSGAGAWEGELAAQTAALRATETHYARSFDGLKYRNLQQPLSADNWTSAELKTLIEAGCCPIWQPAIAADMVLVRDVISRTSFGVVDGTIMDSLDYVRASVAAKLATLSRMSIVDDDEDPPPVEHITQPGSIKALIRTVFNDLEAKGYVTNVADNWDNVVVELSGTTVALSIPTDIVPQLHNIMVRLDSSV